MISAFHRFSTDRSNQDEAVQAALWPGEFYEARMMAGFGERMQREREMRSISLEEIAESTKIGCRMLRALEEEDFDKLPGGIFNKGFVRAYAKFLGIDEEQAVTDFQAAFVEKQQKHATNGAGANGLHRGEILPEVDAMAVETPRQPDQAAGFMRAAVIIVCVLGIGGLAWKFMGSRLTSPAPAPQVAADANAPVQTSRPPENAAPSQPLASVPSDPALRSDAAELKPAVNDPVESLAPADGQFRLLIHAKETTWVQITADGKVLLAGEIPPSSRRSFSASREMVVKLGNAPAVELSYNGKPLPQFSPEQKTRTLTFTPDGLQQ